MMMDFNIYLTSFISILVAISVLSVLPIFISFTEEIAGERKKIQLLSFQAAECFDARVCPPGT